MKTPLTIVLVLISLLANSKVKPNHKKSYEEIQKSYQSHREEYFSSLTALIEKSLDKKDCVSAKKYSLEAFEISEIVKDEWKTGGWNYGNAIFVGNMALGFCSFQENNLDQAKAHLKKASESPGSPQLDSFGLNQAEMRLATELLKKGEKQSVIDFLKDCQKFWKPEYSNRYVNSWVKSIEANKIPDFTAYIQ